MNCKTFKNALPDLLLDGGAISNSAARAHLAGCAPCEREYTSLAATMTLLDGWHAPEPSAYFDQKLAVRLREETLAPRLSWFAQLRDRLLFNTGRQFRPALAGVMVLTLMLGGGSYAGLHTMRSTAEVSATVNDLQRLDKDEPALQQMDQLLQDDDGSNDAGANAPS